MKLPRLFLWYCALIVRQVISGIGLRGITFFCINYYFKNFRAVSVSRSKARGNPPPIYDYTILTAIHFAEDYHSIGLSHILLSYYLSRLTRYWLSGSSLYRISLMVLSVGQSAPVALIQLAICPPRVSRM